jgi:hypothetical protein
MEEKVKNNSKKLSSIAAEIQADAESKHPDDVFTWLFAIGIIFRVIFLPNGYL